MKKSNFNISSEKAFQKIKHYCSYQERSHYEVKEKLYSFGLYKNDVEAAISKLIEENFLNEERFARAFARGKFNIKKWGRKKIAQELFLRKVSAYNIRNALEEIDGTTYKMVVQKLAAVKWKALKNEQYINRTVKTINYLLQKGYESNIARESVKIIAEGRKHNC